MKPHFLFIAVLVIGVAIAVGSYIANRAVEVAPAPPGPIACTEQWSCEAWSSCLNGKQFRSCTDEKQCGTLKEKPETSRSCVVSAICGNNVCEAGETYKNCGTDCGTYKPNCTESWSCTTWLSCLGGSQTRTCSDKNVCGTAANRPAQLQTCTVGQCAEDWFCGNWSQCAGGVQTRICTDLDSCGTTVNKPSVSQSCTASCTENWSCSSWGSCVNGTESRTCTDLNGCGTSLNKPPQSQSCGTAPPGIPNAPSNLALLNIQSDRITLNWSDNSSDEDGFVVERKVGTSQSAQFFDFTQLSSGSVAYNDLTVGPDQTYAYRVRAFNATGSSAYSNTESATTSPPAEDTAALCSDGVDNDGDGLIDLADPDCAPFVPPSLSTVTVSSADSSATEGTSPLDTGTFMIARTGGDQTQSLVVSFTMDPTSTASVSDYTLSSNGSVTIPANQSSATVTLTPVDDTIVESQEDAILQLSSNPSAYTLGSPSSAIVHIADNDAPAVPIVSVTATDPDAAETLGLPLNTGTFRITRSVSSPSSLPVNITISNASTATAGFDYQAITSPQIIPGGATFVDVTVTPIDDTEVEQSETVILNLATGSGYNVGGSSSAMVTIADNDQSVSLPAAPSNLTTTVFNTGTLTTTGRIILDWKDNANNEDSYKIERSLDNVNFFLRDTIPAGSTAWNDLTVFGNKHYYYRVKSSNAAGDSAPSNVDVATTIMAPTNLAATQVTSTQAALSWTDNATIETAYIVERSTTGGTTGFTAFPALPPNTTTFINTNLTPNTSYWYRAKTRDGVGDSPYSNVIQVITNANLSTVTVSSSTDASATEGTPPTDTGAFTVTRSGGDQTQSLVVSFTMDPTSTASASDYTLSPPNNQVTIPANQSSATITLTPVDDTIVEPPPPETAILNLSSNPSAYTLGSPSNATVTITDNDPPPPGDTTPPDITTFTLTPGDGQVVIVYSGSDPGSPSTPPVHYIVIRGTNQSVVDGVPVANFANPGSGVTVVVPDTTQAGSFIDTNVTNGTIYWYRLRVCDSVSPNPNCKANQAQSATPAAPASTPTVSVTASDPNAAELNQDPGTFTITRTGGDQSQSLTVFYSMAGSATQVDDYAIIPSSTQATIPNGSASVVVTVTPVDDAISELTETAVLRLSPGGTSYNVVAPGNATVSITDSDTITISAGAASVVFDYPANACNTSPDHWDAADANVHAIKNHLGELVLASGNAPDNYFMYSSTPSFDDLQRDCSKPVLSSANTDDTTGLLFPPETFNHQQWITSFYRVGQAIYALAHNEYHDARDASDPPCDKGRVFSDNPCWHNSINLAVSATDGGHSFRQNATNANHVVAFPNLTWDPQSKGGKAPVYGYMSPSNIIKKSDGYYYVMFFAITSTNGQSRGSCLMRTADLATATSWRAWDGSGFNIAMSNPYTSTPQACAFVSLNQIADLHETLTYNTYLQKYFVVGTSQGLQGCGFYFSTSDDLITWAPKQLLRTAPLTYCGGSFQNAHAYPSIIDHAQLNDPNDPNFEKSGNQPYLYYIYIHDNPGFNRDLMRQQITICQAGKPVSGICP